MREGEDVGAKVHKMTNDKHIEAVASKIMGVLFYECQPSNGDVFGFCDDIKHELAKAAIAATHEQYKPLVEALEYYARNHHHLPTNAPNFAHEALANMPEELRG